MLYKAVLFDLDGTLLDTLEDLGDAVNRVLAKKGFPTHAMEAYRYFVGDGSAMLIQRALPPEARSEEMLQSCLKAFLEDYGQHWKVKTQPYPGVADMLDALTAQGLRLAVLSNKFHEFTQKCVRQLLPRWTFDIVFGQRPDVPRKPDPAGAREVASLLHIPPMDFVYLGDTAIDMITATAAGMYPVGVLWGFRPGKELQDAGARVLLEQPLDVLEVLNGP